MRLGIVDKRGCIQYSRLEFTTKMGVHREISIHVLRVAEAKELTLCKSIADSLWLQNEVCRPTDRPTDRPTARFQLNFHYHRRKYEVLGRNCGTCAHELAM